MKTNKVIVYLTIIVAYTAVASYMPERRNVKYHRFMGIPGDDNNILHIVDLLSKPDYQRLEEISKNPFNNEYFLFTLRNPNIPQKLSFDDVKSITSSNFKAGNPTVVLVHGWLCSKDHAMNPTIRDAFLGKSDVNVIVVDWSLVASLVYPTAVAGVPIVGRELGQFLELLNRVTGDPFSSMQLAGFSLGAHVVGNAGREVGGRIGRVTGLDPAGPLWDYNPERLHPADGIYVEAIHTNGAFFGLGINFPVAQVDFFVNGGKYQPGCDDSTCNHNRSWKLFAASVTFNHLVGRQCPDMIQIESNNCYGPPMYMGNDIMTKRGTGIYRVNTGSNYPY